MFSAVFKQENYLFRKNIYPLKVPLFIRQWRRVGICVNGSQTEFQLNSSKGFGNHEFRVFIPYYRNPLLESLYSKNKKLDKFFQNVSEKRLFFILLGFASVQDPSWWPTPHGNLIPATKPEKLFFHPSFVRDIKFEVFRSLSWTNDKPQKNYFTFFNLCFFMFSVPLNIKNFLKSILTRILVHGYTDSGSAAWIQNMKTAFIQKV